MGQLGIKGCPVSCCWAAPPSQTCASGAPLWLCQAQLLPEAEKRGAKLGGHRSPPFRKVLLSGFCFLLQPLQISSGFRLHR